MFEARRYMDEEKIYMDTVRELDTDGSAARRFFNSQIKEKRLSDQQRQKMLNDGTSYLRANVMREEYEFAAYLAEKNYFLQEQIEAMKVSLREQFEGAQKKFEASVLNYENQLTQVEKQVTELIKKREVSEYNNQKEFNDKMQDMTRRLDEYEAAYAKEYEEIAQFQTQQAEKAQQQIDEITATRQQNFSQKEQEIEQGNKEANEKMQATWESVAYMIDELRINCAGEAYEREENERKFLNMMQKMKDVISKMYSGKPTV